MKISEHKLLKNITTSITLNYWLGLIYGGIFAVSCYQAIFTNSSIKTLNLILILTSVALAMRNQSDIADDAYKAVRRAAQESDNEN